MAAVPEFHIGVFKAEGCYSRLYFCLHPKKDIFSSIQLMAIFEETPSFVVARIVPLCAVTMAFAIDRPIP